MQKNLHLEGKNEYGEQGPLRQEGRTENINNNSVSKLTQTQPNTPTQTNLDN